MGSNAVGTSRVGRGGRRARPGHAQSAEQAAGRGAGGGWSVGQEVLLAFRPEAVEARAAERDGAWVGVVRSSVYVSGHVEYVVEIGKFTVRAIGPDDARLPHEARARLCVSPRAVRIWPRSDGA